MARAEQNTAWSFPKGSMFAEIVTNRSARPARAPRDLGELHIEADHQPDPYPAELHDEQFVARHEGFALASLV